MLIALVVWSFFLWRAANLFKPGLYSLHYFNSDCAIPVLMSNDERPLTLFNLYYYGTDRWGGWPFLLAQVFRRVTGYQWSEQSLSIMQTGWLFIGAWVIAGLSKKDWHIAGLAFLLTLCLHGQTRYQIFWLSQVYAWQLTAVLLSWFSLRRMFDRASQKGVSSWSSGKWLLPAFLFSYLAIWSSVASIPFLLFLFAVEAARSFLRRSEASENQRLLRLTALGLLSILAAALAEWLQKMSFRRHGLKHYASEFRTAFQLDNGFLLANLKVQINQIIMLKWWPLHLIATLTVLAVLGALLFALLTKRVELLEKLKEVSRNDTVVLMFGAYGLAVINFVLAVVVTHVRINKYEDRYLTFTSLFGPVAGILALFLIVSLLAQRTRLADFARPALLVAGLALLFFKFPAPGYRHEYVTFTNIATALAQKSPRGILLGDYWGTYVFAALQPLNRMTPVPLEGKENRMPWTRDMVREAESVVVEYRQSKLGEAGNPPPYLSQYGNSLRLADAQWYANSDFAFALYVKN